MLINQQSFKKFLAGSILAVSAFLANAVFSQDLSVTDDISVIKNTLALSMPGMPIGSIVPSPVDGLYEVNIQDGQILYASADGQFFLTGDLYALTSKGLVNMGEQKRNDIRAAKISAIDESEMIVYEAEGERKATLTVFTDVDCPYCRKLHAEVHLLNQEGIAVRYLAFPRTGLDTETYFKMVAIWCSQDRINMFASASRGGSIPSEECANPVAEQYQLGQEVNVTGTPALVLEDGTILPGYVPAERLIAHILDTP